MYDFKLLLRVVFNLPLKIFFMWNQKFNIPVKLPWTRWAHLFIGVVKTVLAEKCCKFTAHAGFAVIWWSSQTSRANITTTFIQKFEPTWFRFPPVHLESGFSFLACGNRHGSGCSGKFGVLISALAAKHAPTTKPAHLALSNGNGFGSGFGVLSAKNLSWHLK